MNGTQARIDPRFDKGLCPHEPQDCREGWI